MAGSNIPLGVWACGEDTSFMTVAGKILGGDYKQFVVKNVLKVHNRNHPKKRMYVEGMTNEAAHINRENNKSWMKNHKVCETNLHNLNNNSIKDIKNKPWRAWKIWLTRHGRYLGNRDSLLFMLIGFPVFFFILSNFITMELFL